MSGKTLLFAFILFIISLVINIFASVMEKIMEKKKKNLINEKKESIEKIENKEN